MVFGLKVLARGVDIVDRRAGFKVFGVCNDANPLCFVRVPCFLMCVGLVFIVFFAGFKAFWSRIVDSRC